MSVLLSLSLSLWEPAACRECGFSFCQSHGVSLAGEKTAWAVGSWSCLCLGEDRSVYLARPDPHPLAQNVLLIKLMFLISVQRLQWSPIWLSKSHKERDCHLPDTLKLHHFIPLLFYHLSILDSYEFIKLRLSGKLLCGWHSLHHRNHHLLSKTDHSFRSFCSYCLVSLHYVFVRSIFLTSIFSSWYLGRGYQRSPKDQLLIFH